MKTLAVNSNNDLYLTADKNLTIAYDIFAIEQAVAQAAKAQFNEMVLAYDQGMPNMQTVWGGSPNVAQFEAYLRKTVMEVPGVVEIRELDISVANNVLSYEITILTIYGQTMING